mmetsp:Transcript_16397/g.41680  ORF Transcript_16397/g.41680 Transcript_16397/m.41680 type:complete len:273 (+) Transcript_16397:203-1021(+)
MVRPCTEVRQQALSGSTAAPGATSPPLMLSADQVSDTSYNPVAYLGPELRGRDPRRRRDQVVLRVHEGLYIAQEGTVRHSLQHRPPLRADCHCEHIHLVVCDRILDSLHEIIHAAGVLAHHLGHLLLQLPHVAKQRAGLPLHERRGLYAQNVGCLHQRCLVKAVHVLLQAGLARRRLGDRRVGVHLGAPLLVLRAAHGVEQCLQAVHRVLVGQRLGGLRVLQGAKRLLELETLVHPAQEVAKHDGCRIHLRHLQLAHLHARVAECARSRPHH